MNEIAQPIAANETAAAATQVIPENKLTNYEIGAVYFDVYMKEAVEKSDNAHIIEGLRATYAGKYAELKDLAIGEKRDEVLGHQAVAQEFEHAEHAYNRSLTTQLTQSLIGAVRDNKLPEAVVTEIQRREAIKMNPSANGQQNGNGQNVQQPATSATATATANGGGNGGPFIAVHQHRRIVTGGGTSRAGNMFRNAALSILLVAAGFIANKEYNNGDAIQANGDAIKALTTQSAKADSTMNAKQDTAKVTVAQGFKAEQDALTADTKKVLSSESKTRNMLRRLQQFNDSTAKANAPKPESLKLTQ
jgi:hypothetical protein